MLRSRLTIATVLLASVGFSVCLADVDPSVRTADMPDSWLVLYNLNDAESVLWATWYRQVRGIPLENVLGLDASTDEHLPDLATAQSQILGPVQNYLTANPQIEQRIMGIVVGYRLPGHFGAPPVIPNVGGYAIANALQDLTNTTTWEMNLDAPHMVPPYGVMPVGGRLTKATMSPGHYMTARIDAPTITKALNLTLRAMNVENGDGSLLDGMQVWFDFSDPVLPGDEWYWLRQAVENPDLDDVPWGSFDADTEQTPDDAVRFGTHDVQNWDDPRLFGAPTGPRVLAFNLNSWGATTVRSTQDEGGRYVPNAIEAGYAASIGATGEPQCCVAPFPDTLLAALREGWTLGESFYLANPYDDWMWILVGDPLLELPCWFAADAGTTGIVATTIDSAASCADQGGNDYCLALALTGPPTIEPRLSGVTRLVLQTADSVDAETVTTATVTCSVSPYNGGNITVTSDGTATVTVDLDALPDMDCCTIDFAGGITGSLRVRLLVGDVNVDGAVSSSDLASISQRLGMVVDGSNFLFDVNGDGSISAADDALAGQRTGRVGTVCP